MELSVYCDGGSRGNPGPAAIGITVKCQNIIQISKCIGIKTNNQAEYQAVIHALEWLVHNLDRLNQKPEKINVFLDSTLVVNQINGKFKVKNAKIRELLFKVKTLENQVGPPIIYHRIPREENGEADRLVNEALDKD